MLMWVLSKAHSLRECLSAKWTFLLLCCLTCHGPCSDFNKHDTSDVQKEKGKFPPSSVIILPQEHMATFHHA